VPFLGKVQLFNNAEKMGHDPPNCKQTLKQIEKSLLELNMSFAGGQTFPAFLAKYPHIISANLWGCLIPKVGTSSKIKILDRVLYS